MAYDLSDYVDVAERIEKFHEQYPEGSLQSDWTLELINGAETLVVTGRAYRTPDDPRPGIGHASEPVPGRTPYTKDSELMVGETSAWGRALAALGFEVRRGIASRQEVQNRSTDGGATPQAAPPPPAPQAGPGDITPAQKGAITQLLNAKLAKELHEPLKALVRKPGSRQEASTMIDRLKKLEPDHLADFLALYDLTAPSTVPADTGDLEPEPTVEKPQDQTEASLLGVQEHDD